MGRETTPATGAAVAVEEAAASGGFPDFTVSDVTAAPRTAAGTVVDTATDNAPAVAVSLLESPSGLALMSGKLAVAAAATLAEALVVAAGAADGVAIEVSFAAEAAKAAEVAGAVAEAAAAGALADGD